jgi:DNA repair protein RadA/Sms
MLAKWNTIAEIQKQERLLAEKWTNPFEPRTQAFENKRNWFDRRNRMDTTDAELNRVLGGGIVPGSLILLGGEPGRKKTSCSKSP